VFTLGWLIDGRELSDLLPPPVLHGR
jgi:hypothetical protein